MEINKHQVTKIGEKIRNFRKRAGKSQFELELEIEASPGSMSRIESGQVNPTKETLRKIIEALELKSYDAMSLFELEVNDLQGLVELAKKLSNSLDIDQLLQNAADQIAYDLKLFGCLVFLCDDEYVYAKTQTETWYTKFVNQILPQAFNTLKISLKETENYVVRSIIERKPQISTFLRDFSKKVFPDKISDTIQRFNGTSCIISFPMIVDNTAIGAIIFSKSKGDNFNNEFEILSAFVEHVSTSIMNALKYRELENKINILEKKVQL